MLTGIHILLTYTCTYQCDHCFLSCGPEAEGTFTLEQLRAVFREIPRIGSIRTLYFEGGEPFLYYPVLVEGLRLARSLGLETGIVTNCYWATGVEDATLWLGPLRELEVSDLSLSDDAFHGSIEPDSPPKLAAVAAGNLGIPCATICVEPCEVRFRGRAAEKLTPGLPTRPLAELTSCPHEDLERPERVHLDCFGHVHLCQGLSMGNMWETPLAALVRQYDPRAHPICGPLLAGGPARLAAVYGVDAAPEYADECHGCYAVRKALLDRFPQYLAPRQVYGPDAPEN